MFAWRPIVWAFAIALLGSSTAGAEQHLPMLPAPEVTVDGAYAQAWLYESSLDLGKDLAETAEQGKRLVILWEGEDCFDCKPMHEVNLRIPRIVEKITARFNVIRLDILGERTVTDLDGETLTEEELATRSNVTFTPTLQFLSEFPDPAAGRTIKESEVFRSEGYFKPFHFNFLFHYVESNGYETQPHFQRWLGDIGRGLEGNGIHYDLMADALPPDLPQEY
ncbi:MAG: thioredoxin fold domain-containing protein [Rhodospirillales bacterium]